MDYSDILTELNDLHHKLIYNIIPSIEFDAGAEIEFFNFCVKMPVITQNWSNKEVSIKESIKEIRKLKDDLITLVEKYPSLNNIVGELNVWLVRTIKKLERDSSIS